MKAPSLLGLVCIVVSLPIAEAGSDEKSVRSSSNAWYDRAEMPYLQESLLWEHQEIDVVQMFPPSSGRIRMPLMPADALRPVENEANLRRVLYQLELRAAKLTPETQVRILLGLSYTDFDEASAACARRSLENVAAVNYGGNDSMGFCQIRMPGPIALSKLKQIRTIAYSILASKGGTVGHWRIMPVPVPLDELD